MIFVMGIDRWRAERDWPLPDTQHRPYYLHSGGQANSLRGDGTLTTMSPSDEPSDVYLVNPLRPVHSMGGQVILPGATAMGPRDQREVEVRDDVLVYTSPVLEPAISRREPGAALDARRAAALCAPNQPQARDLGSRGLSTRRCRL
jgi:uncharacterized protein